MATFSITAEVLTEEAERVLRELPYDVMQKAVKAGVLTASKTATKETKKSIRARYAIKGGVLDKAAVTVRMVSHAGLPAAELRGSRSTRTVNQWGARETKSGLTFRIYKGQQEVIRRGFIAKGLPFYRKGPDRYPLDVAHGPSVDGMFGAGKYADEMRAEVEQVIEPRLKVGIDRSIRGWAARNNLL